MNAQTVNDILGHVSTGAFTALGLLSLRFWFLRRDRPSLWAALCFGTLTAVVLAGYVIPENPSSSPEEVELRLLVVVLLMFPYLLFRFAAAFEPASRRVEWLIGASAVALSAWTFALPDFPQEGEPRSTGFDLYLGALALYWGALSLFVAVKLWRAGRDQPSVARRRMRLLSFAAALLTVAILLAVGNPEGTSGLALITSIVGIASAVTFGLGLAPPAILRLQWRRPELEKTRKATGGLIAATTPEQVTSEVLPAMAELVGARAVFLLDTEDVVLASHGAPPEAVRSLNEADPGVVKLDTPSGALVVWAGPYSPFFGTEEMDILRSLGALTSLALDRSSLFVREREARLALERADELKTNFIALAAHELRTPVTSVHGVVNTLDRLGDRLSERDRIELRDALLTQSERLRRLVDQLLDLSRLDADSVPIHPVADRGARARGGDRCRFGGRAVERGGDQDPERAHGEDRPDRPRARRLESPDERASTRRLAGPRDGRPPGPAFPHRRAGLRQRSARRVRGRPLRALQPQRRGARRGLGSGLGLSIARSYARAHGGDLVYEDAAPRGARFELVVPQHARHVVAADG